MLSSSARAQPGDRRVRAHPARVRPLIAVVRSLEVLCDGERNRVAAVTDREDRHLRPLEQLLDDDAAAEGIHRQECVIELRLRCGRRTRPCRRRARRLSPHTAGVRPRAERLSHACRGHHVLRERLRAFDASCGRARPEHGDPRVAQHVGDAGTSGASGPTTTRSTPSEPANPSRPSPSSARIGWHSPSRAIPGVPGRRVEFGDRRRLRELPGERVLAPARTDEEDTHRASLCRSPRRVRRSRTAPRTA